MDWFLYDRDLRHERINPNKPGRFQGSFFWSGVNLTPLIFQELILI